MEKRNEGKVEKWESGIVEKWKKMTPNSLKFSQSGLDAFPASY
jgi:hypothetical protein